VNAIPALELAAAPAPKPAGKLDKLARLGATFASHLEHAAPVIDPAPSAPPQPAPPPQPGAIGSLLDAVTALVRDVIAQVGQGAAPATPTVAPPAGGPPASPSAPAPDPALAALGSQLRALAPAAAAAQAEPVTPLAQAAHDYIAELERAQRPAAAQDAPRAPSAAEAVIAIAPAPGDRLPDPGPVRAQPAAAPAPPQAPDAPTNPSHVHLIVEDGPARVVVTVAVRGDEVRVAMRSNDDAVTAGLARNAGALDHALRARGMDLQDFTAERDPDARPRDRQGRERPQHPDTERFQLEEHA